MCCPTEEGLIRGKLQHLPEVHAMQFNLLNRTLLVEHQAGAAPLLVETIASLGMQALPLAAETRVRIEQMDCPTEERLITDKLARQPGIEALQFNLMQRVLTIRHNPDDLEPALQAIRELGFTPQPEGGESPPVAPEQPQSGLPWRLILAGVAAFMAEVVHFTDAAPEWVVALMALGAVLASGLEVYKKGWIALKNLNLNINALMSIAVTGAILIGQWPEAAMVMVLFAIAERIEAKSLDRARNAIRGLMALTPEQATVRQADGSWQSLEVAQVAIGSVVRLRPGERIGLDGQVLEGHSTVDQSPITGESLPIEKSVGDTLFAGTINQSGALEYRVSTAASNSALSRIIKAVEEAQGARAPTQRFVDRFARIYTPLVFLLSLAVAVVPPLLLNGGWYEWVYRALVLLVVACPCALVISTPVSIVSGLAAAARKGILVKGGVYLENGRHITHLALDKTGTLTHGKPLQTDYQALIESDAEPYRELAASLAARSDHPVSQAVAKAAQEQGVALSEVQAFEALPGRGVRGVIDGQRYQLGNHRLLEELGLCSAEIEAQLDGLEREGKTVILLSDENRALALFAVADTLKASSREAIATLHDMGIKTLMLTGDNQHTAQAIAAQVGIDEARGDLLPADKLATVEGLLGQRGVVAMVGDGINDAPALARADVGFAMAAIGTDTAIETADVAIMDDDLRKIPTFIRLSRQTATILKQNIALALGIKAIFLAVTITGHATMWMAVFADMGVSLLVVLNGLRLLRK
ncbi:heavy metal translocating P-type ATPase [Pseudomonas daroniae]|uniref:Heavy metal translocating P-type ATPase n=2 Tax=Pseudomonadales TaxID=72274 RepID=A0A4Q9QHD4_9GAMM|nr:heavy metal translocating P-type ATPase [Pseudomonas daroniae]TBU78096.1 heavy metal translocating P-type ATPase [Pseudomonas sp. FRB 228]TBU88782.1 heavy metal translocating P-type ATPase [Pseudomonas daroniae]